MQAETRPLRRIAMKLAYDGTAFSGFQVQREGRTVAGVVEAAARILGAGIPDLKCAGRTDAGVHAEGQVIALSLPTRLEERRVLPAMNANLPEDVRVLAAWVCSPGFDPRRDAVMRTYVYRLCAGEVLSPIHRHTVAATRHALNMDLASRAAEAYLGQWEFREWRSTQCQGKRTLLTISGVGLTHPTPDRPWMEFTVAARSFLHHMVRFLVGGVVAVATRRLELDELKSSLTKGRRPAIVVPAEACGLTLARVEYPADSRVPG